MLFVLSLPAVSLAAQEQQAAPVQAKQAEATVPQELQSPRATMATFIHAMNDIKRGRTERIEEALRTLDLSEVNPLVRRERGSDLAWMLLEILDKTRRIDLERIPNHREGKPWVFERYGSGAVRISRSEDGRWLFDRETVAALPAILDEVVQRKRKVEGLENDQWLPFHIRLQAQLPAWMRDRTLILQNWQWLGLLLIIAVGVVVDRLARFVARLGMRRWLHHFPQIEKRIDEADQRLRPVGLMLMALVWWLGILLLGLPEPILLVLLVTVKLLASLAAVWTAWRLVDVISALLAEKAELTDSRVDDVLVPMVRRTLKIFIAVGGIIFIADNLNIDVTGLLAGLGLGGLAFALAAKALVQNFFGSVTVLMDRTFTVGAWIIVGGIVFVADNLNIDVTGLFAGLGLGGLAFALAAKDLVQNFFGSVTVLMDRTFTVGDWIIVDDIEGTVEHMGFRSTRIRTFYNSLVTVPNSRFITAEVDNMGARRYRRYKQKFGLTYDTPPEKIEAFCEGLREIVRQHPYMRKDYFQIWFNDLGASALEILIYVFWETPDWTTELRERHRFLLDAMRLADALGVEFAFPTQTVHLYQEEKQGEEGAAPSLEEAREAARRIAQT
ncbi:MAG: mechanosensitive ion channel family protein [Gammaproteobacteria bacterium]|nr:MAG: mechanosensitive ion channel family protein [Gammaproteobacteria bacterium]